MSIGVSDFSYLYRQARRAVQGLAEPIEAPIACFTLKHVFREAAKAKDLPQEQLKALQALGELLQGVKDKFCGTMPGVEPVYEATAESDALLADVLKKIDVMAASLVNTQMATDYDIYRQPSEFLLDCKTCGGHVQPGPDVLRRPWRGATCSLKVDDPHFKSCHAQQISRREALKKCGARPHDFDKGFSLGSPDSEKKEACVKRIKLI